MRLFNEALSLLDSSRRLRGEAPYRRALEVGGITLFSLGEPLAKRILPKVFLSPGFQCFCGLLAHRRFSTLVAKFALTGYGLAESLLTSKPSERA